MRCKKISLSLYELQKGARKTNKIMQLAKNMRVGTCISVKVLSGAKNEYRILKLARIEGKHYIFKSKFGWVEAYTINQLGFGIANKNIIIVKEDEGND